MDSEKVVHLINKKGGKKLVEKKLFNEEIQKINENISSDYDFDFDWYLSHGFKKAEDVFNSIENGTS